MRKISYNLIINKLIIVFHVGEVGDGSYLLMRANFDFVSLSSIFIFQKIYIIMILNVKNFEKSFVIVHIYYKKNNQKVINHKIVLSKACLTVGVSMIELS